MYIGLGLKLYYYGGIVTGGMCPLEGYIDVHAVYPWHLYN